MRTRRPCRNPEDKTELLSSSELNKILLYNVNHDTQFQNIVYLFLLEIASWRAFTQLRKEVLSFIVSVCPSVGNNSVSAGRIFVKFFYFGRANIFCERIYNSVKIGKEWHFTWWTAYVYDLSPWMVFVIMTDCVLCEVRAGTAGRVLHRARSIVKLRFWHFINIFWKFPRLYLGRFSLQNLLLRYGQML